MEYNAKAMKALRESTALTKMTIDELNAHNDALHKAGEHFASILVENDAGGTEGFDKLGLPKDDQDTVGYKFFTTDGKTPINNQQEAIEIIQGIDGAMAVVHNEILGRDTVKIARAQQKVKSRNLDEHFYAAQKKHGLNAHEYLLTLDTPPAMDYDAVASVVNSEEYKAVGGADEWAKMFAKNDARHFDLENIDPYLWLDKAPIQNTMDRGNWADREPRTGVVVPEAVRPVQVMDMFPREWTSHPVVRFERETINTDAADSFTSGSALSPSDIDVDDITVNITNVGHYFPLNEIDASDEMRLRTLINFRLPDQIRRKLDLLLIEGDGTAPNMRGLGQTTGIQTYAKVANDTIIDALLTAKTSATVKATKNVGMPTGYILSIGAIERINRVKTTEGAYVYANPGMAERQTLWGLPIAQYNGGIVDTIGYVGDFQGYSGLAMRQGINIGMGHINEQFIEIKICIRGYVRAVLIIYRPSAFVKVTGI